MINNVFYDMYKLDLSYAMSVMRKIQSNPGEGHWVAIKNILKYLRRTKDVFLKYGDGDGDIDLHVKGHSDANFQLIQMTPNLNQVMC